MTAEAQTFDSGLLAAGRRFAHTFDRAGTFAYLCVLHPQMRGSVIVGAGGPVERAQSPAARDPAAASRARAVDTAETPRAPLLGGSEVAAVLGGIPALLALGLVVYLRMARAHHGG